MSVALSTIGMAAYSALALLGGPRTLQEVGAFCAQQQRFPVPTQLLEDALFRLVALGRVDHSEGRFEARGPRGYIVRCRDRSDAQHPDGGWKDWIIEGPNGARVPLDQAVR